MVRVCCVCVYILLVTSMEQYSLFWWYSAIMRIRIIFLWATHHQGGVVMVSSSVQTSVAMERVSEQRESCVSAHTYPCIVCARVLAARSLSCLASPNPYIFDTYHSIQSRETRQTCAKEQDGCETRGKKLRRSRQDQQRASR